MLIFRKYYLYKTNAISFLLFISHSLINMKLSRADDFSSDKRPMNIYTLKSIWKLLYYWYCIYFCSLGRQKAGYGRSGQRNRFLYQLRTKSLHTYSQQWLCGRGKVFAQICYLFLCFCSYVRIKRQLQNALYKFVW